MHQRAVLKSGGKAQELVRASWWERERDCVLLGPGRLPLPAFCCDWQGLGEWGHLFPVEPGHPLDRGGQASPPAQ